MSKKAKSPVRVTKEGHVDKGIFANMTNDSRTRKSAAVMFVVVLAIYAPVSTHGLEFWILPDTDHGTDG